MELTYPSYFDLYTMSTLIRYSDFPKAGDEWDTIMTISSIVMDMDVHVHNIKAMHDWDDFKDLSSTKGRGMFFIGVKRDHVALLVINLWKLLSKKTGSDRQSFQILLDKMKTNPPIGCAPADLDLLQSEHDAFHVAEADILAAIKTYRDKRFAHHDPDAPDDGTHLFPDIERMVNHCTTFLDRIMTVVYKPKKPLKRMGGHPTMYIDGLIEDYREHARLKDKVAAQGMITEAPGSQE